MRRLPASWAFRLQPLTMIGLTPAPGCASKWEMGRPDHPDQSPESHFCSGQSTRQFRISLGNHVAEGMRMTNQKLDEELVFNTARKIESPEARNSYLDQVCCGNAALQARVQALLKVHEQDANFLKSVPEAAGEAPSDSDINEGPGSVIGPYKLLEQIGEGGFGVVFMAEQQRPVRRKVALKVLKPGMDTRSVVARFEAERQALALMKHQNIARVLDAGETASGRPYFVMELVRGIPITTFCDDNHLLVRDRLRLFLNVSQ